MSDGNRVGTIDDLHASATRRTGLTDFGPDDYTDGLAVLLDSYASEAGLTPLGAKMQRAFLRGALTARLLSEAAWQANPDHAQVPIDRPVFITGLPRTGTTALHRLLTADPSSQGLEMWLAQVPQPRPPRRTWADNPVFQYIQAGFSRHHEEHPEFMGVHYIAADQVEECWQLLQQSMRSVSFETLAHVPGYSAWLRGQDWTGAYHRHRRNLQLIGLHDGGQALGAQEPEPPVRARRAARGLSGRAGDPDSPLAADGDRLRLQPGRARVGRLVDGLCRRHHRALAARPVGAGPVAVHRRARSPRSGRGSTTCATTTWWRTRSAPWRRSTGTSGCR